MPPDAQYYKAQVIETYPARDTTSKDGGLSTFIRVRIENGDLKDAQAVIEADSNSMFGDGGEREVHKGQSVVVYRTVAEGKTDWQVVDQYRLTSLSMFTAVFLVLVILVARKRGFGAIVGLLVTVGILMGFALPQIMSGAKPLPILLLSAVAIASASLYLAHGVNRRTHVAAISTLLTLALSVAISSAMVALSHIYGFGDEQAFYLQDSPFGAIDLRGLFLGGIIVSAVGVLDDVTTGAAAVVDELAKANPGFGFIELFKRGMSVGTEHITSLVNTLFLAYAGVSLPLFLVYQANTVEPLWTFLNSEFVAQEIVRTLSGSMTLVLAVPVTTALAAWVMHARKKGSVVDNATKLH